MARNIIYLTISVPDTTTKSRKLDLQPTHISFIGYSETTKKTYKLYLEFFKEIDVSESKTNISDKEIFCMLRKKEQEATFWPRLTKDAHKLHFVKIDYDKWIDEDEQDEEEEIYMGVFKGDADHANYQGLGK